MNDSLMELLNRESELLFAIQTKNDYIENLERKLLVAKDIKQDQEEKLMQTRVVIRAYFQNLEKNYAKVEGF